MVASSRPSSRAAPRGWKWLRRTSTRPCSAAARLWPRRAANDRARPCPDPLGCASRLTTGAPITLVVENRDAANWGDVLAVEKPAAAAEPVRVPRPGHADLGGALLYDLPDLRDVIERASAGDGCASRLRSRGPASAASAGLRGAQPRARDRWREGGGHLSQGLATVDADPVRCLDRDASQAMQAAVAAAGERGDTLGGVFEVVAPGFPRGWVRTCRQTSLGPRWRRPLMGVPAVKGVEVGLGFAASRLPGQRYTTRSPMTSSGATAARQPCRRHRRRDFDRRAHRGARRHEARRDPARAARSVELATQGQSIRASSAAMCVRCRRRRSSARP